MPRAMLPNIGSASALVLIDPETVASSAARSPAAGLRRETGAPMGLATPRCAAALAPRNSGEARQLEHQVSSVNAGNSGWIQRRNDLTDVAANDVQARDGAEDHLHISHRYSSWLRNARAGSLLGIETVNVDCDVSRAVTYDTTNLITNCAAAQHLVFVHGDHTDADQSSVVDVVIVVPSPAQSDLDDPPWIEQPLLNRPPDKGSVVALGTHKLVESVRVRIDLHQPNGMFLCDCS